MNKRTTYELIMADKANQQPLPDRADAIWAAVSAGLDALPASGNDSSGADATPVSKGIAIWQFVWYGAAVAATIAMAVIFWYNHDQPKHPKTKSVPVPTIPIQEPKKDSLHTTSFRQTLPVTSSKKEKPAIIDSTQTINDTALTSRIPKAVQLQLLPTPVVKTPDTIPLPPAKKPRGVKGINHRDYKIVPAEQDSVPLKKQH